MFQDYSHLAGEREIRHYRIAPGNQSEPSRSIPAGIYGQFSYSESVLAPVPEPESLQRMRLADGSWLIWFGGRRTPIGVSANSRSEAISKARKKKKRGGDNVKSARQATAAEKKTAANGGWVRTGPNGEKPGESKLRGYGPKPKK